MKLKNIAITEKYKYMLENWVDYQKEFGKIVDTKKLISLEKALDALGIDFVGKKHDALYDARNTSKLFVEQESNDITKGIACIKKYIVKEEKTTMTTLGDLFDLALKSA